jgi:hypothetical protein
LKKVVLQRRRNFYQRFNVDIGSVEDAVNVGAVAVELSGEPRGAAALALKFGFYQVSDVHAFFHCGLRFYFLVNVAK